MVIKKVIAGTAVAALAVIGLVALAPAAQAAPVDPAPVAKVTDPETYHQFPGSANPATHTTSQNPGRIWTDKTTFDTDIPVPDDMQQPGIGPITVQPDELAVALSALGSTRHVRGEEQVPIDVSMVIDNSYSMIQCTGSTANCNGASGPTDWQNSRAYAMVQALDVAIGIIADDNAENRIAITQFGTNAGVLQALGAPVSFASGANAGHYVAISRAGNGAMTIALGNGQTLVVGTGTTGGAAQSTNIQRGIVTGMNQLANQPTASVTGANQRIPNTILFTDGEPTYSATQTAWWAPGDTGTNQGPASPTATQYYGNGFLAAMAASLLKKKVESVYNDADPTLTATARVYTIGLGINALSEQGRDLALATLNPKDLLGQTTNTMTTGFTNAFTAYRAGGTPVVPVNSGSATFTVTHPTAPAYAPFNPTGADDLRYNDAYYSPVTQEDLISVFRHIAQQIVDAAPNHPVDITDGEATTSGYVTFTDPVGEFMNVTDMNRITFCSVLQSDAGADPTDCTQQTFVNPTYSTTTTSTGSDTAYTFHGSYTANDLYGATDVSRILITVHRSNDLAVGDTVTVRIPAALLPLRDTWVQQDVDEKPTSMSVYVSHPVHVFYKVAPKPGVVAALADPLSLNAGGSEAGSALASYIRENTDADGRVRFYSDDWDSAAKAAGSPDVAQSFASFVPAEQNDFYRFAEASPIYADAGAATRLSASAFDGLDPTTPLWYQTVVFSMGSGGSTDVTKSLATQRTTKAALVAAGVTAADQAGGYLVVPAGTQDYSGRAQNLDHAKCLALTWTDANTPVCADPAGGNKTATDSMARRTIWGAAAVAAAAGGGASARAADGAVNAALGNNAFLSYVVPGRLIIAKHVQADGGLNPNPDQTFGFTVGLGGTVAAGETFPYSVFDASDPTNPVGGGQVGSGGTILLKGDQLAEVLGLPAGATWTVAEQALPPGYTQTGVSGATSGTIALPQATVPRVEFTNTYAPAATTAVAGPSVQKVLDGRAWNASDAFDVRLCPAADPENCDTVTLTQSAQSADFPARTFAAPGVYEFSITEAAGAAAGVTYSAAEYLWTVTVTDDGTGQLHAAATLDRVRGDDGAEIDPAVAEVATFTNSFDADEVGIHLEAEKFVNDLTLPAGDQERAPTVAHQFAFATLGASAGAAPAPTFGGAAGASSATAENVPSTSSVSSPELRFDRSHVGSTYYYAVTEQVPSPPLAGVTYDDVAYVYRLVVGATGTPTVVQVTQSICRTTAAALDTSAIDGGCTAFGATAVRFVNTYRATPATAALSGTKVLDGRPWAASDRFQFELAASGAATEAAVTSGAVVLPAATTVTVGAADASGASAPFAFGAITFHQQGDFQFRVREVVASAPAGVTPDEHWMIADVHVADNNLDGRLEATVTLDGGADASTFTNRWSGGLVYRGVDLSKVLTGRDLALGEFSFTVMPADAASAAIAGLPVGGTTVANGDSTGAPGLSRLLEGIVLGSDDIGRTFVFHVREAGGSLGGVTYDRRQWTITLAPQFSAAGDEFDVVTTVADGATTQTFSELAGDAPAIGFENAYAADPVTASPAFSKTLTGASWDGRSFTFRIVAVTPDAPLPAATTVAVTQANAASFGFGAIAFDTPGIFEYLVHEVIPGDAQGLVDDVNQAEATVTVTDDGQGRLVASIAYDGDQNFVNYAQPCNGGEPTPTPTPTPTLPGEPTPGETAPPAGPSAPEQPACPGAQGPSVGTGGYLVTPAAAGWLWPLLFGFAGLAALGAAGLVIVRRKRG